MGSFKLALAVRIIPHESFIHADEVMFKKPFLKLILFDGVNFCGVYLMPQVYVYPKKPVSKLNLAEEINPARIYLPI